MPSAPDDPAALCDVFDSHRCNPGLDALLGARSELADEQESVLDAVAQMEQLIAVDREHAMSATMELQRATAAMACADDSGRASEALAEDVSGSATGLARELVDLDKDNADMHTRINQLEMEIEDLTGAAGFVGGGEPDVVSLAESGEGLREEGLRLREKLEAAIQGLGHAEKELTTHESRSLRLRESIADAQTNLRELEWLRESGESSFRDARESLKETEQAITDKVTDLKRTEAAKRESAAETEQLRAELVQTKARLAEEKRAAGALRAAGGDAGRLAGEDDACIRRELRAKDDIISRFAARIHEQEMVFMQSAEREKEAKRALTERIGELRADIKGLMQDKAQKDAFAKSQSRELELARVEAGKRAAALEKMTEEKARQDARVQCLEADVAQTSADVRELSDKLAALLEVGRERDEALRRNEELLAAIRAKTTELEAARAGLDAAHSRARGLKNELEGARACAERCKTDAAEARVQRDDLAAKCEDLRQQKQAIDDRVEAATAAVREKNARLAELEARVREKNAEIDAHKYSLELTVNKGEHLFNQITLRMDDYYSVLDSFVDTQLPLIEERYTRELDAFDSVCRASIDMKSSQILQGLGERESDAFEKLQRAYEDRIGEMQGKCSRLELMEIQLKDAIQKYEMFDMMNVDKNKVIQEGMDFVNEKRHALLLFRKNVADLEEVNARLKSLGGAQQMNRSLHDIVRKVGETEKYQEKVSSTLERHRKNIERFYGHSEISFLDRLDLIENNIYKIAGVIFAQFAALVFMWLF